MAKEKADGGPDYVGNIKKAFEVVRHNRYLWYLGILAGGGTMTFNSGGNPGAILEDQDPNTAFIDTLWADVLNWAQTHLMLVVFGVFVVVLISLIFIVLSNMARAGLVQSVHLISDNKKSSFLEGMKFGWHKWWRVFKAGLLVGLVVMLIVAVFAALTITLYFLNLVAGVLFTIFVDLPVLIFMIVFVGLVTEYSLRYICLNDMGTIASLKSGYNLIKTKKKETVLIWLMTVVIGMLSGIVLVMAMFLVGLILFLLGVVIYLLSHIAGVIYIGVTLAVFIFAIVLAGGFVTSFISTYWTLSFKQIEK